MKKIFLVYLIFSLSANIADAQRFGDEWINIGSQYLKLTVNSKGIYRITKTDLDNAGFTNNTQLLKNYQLFFRGQEMAINIVGNPNGNIGPSDYIEFYAMNNDGKQDEELYKPKTARANIHHSLYSDETTYFLTVGTSLGKRMNQAPNINPNLTIDSYFISKILDVPNENWNFDISKSFVPNLIQSYFEPFEGMTSGLFWNVFNASAPKPYKLDIPLTNFAANSGFNTNFETLLVTRSPQSKNIAYNLGNGTTGNINIGLYFTGGKLNVDIPIITNDKIPVNINTTSTVNIDIWSYFYTLIRYPRLPIFVDNHEYEFKENSNNVSRIQLSGASNSVIGYEINDIYNQSMININNIDGNLDIYAGNSIGIKKVFLANNFKKPIRTSIITFENINQALFDFLIVTDKRTRLGADAYKTYRESILGGGYKVLVAETQQLYDRFSYGERNPIAIRRFVDYMASTTQKMKYLFLIGQSISQPNMLKLKEFAGQPSDDYVPTYGFPGSDVLFSSGFGGKSESISTIPTGRLVVTSNSEIIGYLNKVKEHESRTSSTWQKNLLHIVGPKFTNEYSSLYNTMESLRQIAIGSSFAANSANYQTINKPASTFNGSVYSELPVPTDFYTKFNDGVGIIAYYGHGTSTSTGYNIGYMSKQIPAGVGGQLYSNKGKYPVLLAFGCGISDSFFGEKDIASDWVNTPDKGAINALSMSYLSYEAYDSRNLEYLYNTWFGSAPNAKISPNLKQLAPSAMVNAGIGDIVQQASINHAAAFPNGNPSSPSPDLYFVANLEQTMLLGDPSIAVFKNPTITQPLYLTLLAVKAMNENKKTKIRWQTENEFEFNGFEIERSNDAKKFTKIAFVKGNNNSKEQNNYSFDDESPEEGLNYYRLKMIDFDGNTSFSKIVSVEFELPENNLTIFGNPSSNFQFKFKLNEYIENSAKLYDVKGNCLNLKIQKIDSNFYNVLAPLTTIKGSYIFKLQNKKGRNFNKIVVFD